MKQTINQKLSALYTVYTQAFLKVYQSCFPNEFPLPDQMNEFGLINEQNFDQKNRILFILKETNGWSDEDYQKGVFFRSWVNEIAEINFNGKDHAKKYPKIWYNLGRWTTLLQNPFLQVTELAAAKQSVLPALKKIAVTNLNKVRGAASSKTAYNKIAFSDIAGEILRKEISIIQPNIIVCCGTWLPVNKHLQNFQGKLLRMPHPSTPNKSTVSMLQTLLNQI